MKNVNRKPSLFMDIFQTEKMQKCLKIIILFCFLISIHFHLSAQMQCGTDLIHKHKMANDPEYKKNIEKTESEIFNIIQNREKSGLRSDEVYTIPVVVHVIHLGEPIGTGTNISNQQIYDAITGLNDRWKNVIGDGVDMGFEFCLASRNPNNQPTMGINRVNGSGINRYTSSGITWDGSCGASETAIKDLSKWPTYDYYNIWVVNKICGTLSSGSGIAGYADYPSGHAYDGTVIGQVFMNYNSVTLAHEIGHGFNLYHTFEGPNSNCPPNNICLQDGDRVCDTPPHRQSDCGTTNPCTSLGLWDNSRRNFMSYCGNSTRFTNGQKERSRAAAIVHVRKHLLTSLGCIAPLENDISIVKINEPTIKTIYIDNCPGQDSLNLNVRVQNVGLDTISTIKFNIFINGNLLSPITWYGNVVNNKIINIDLLKIKIDTGLFNIKIVVDSVNNKVDENNLNNNLDFEFNCKRINSIKIENDITNSNCIGLDNGSVLLNASKHVSILEDFEGETDWTIVNGDDTNKWVIGNSTSSGGDKSIYISNNGSSNAFDINKASIVHIYKDFNFPSNASNIKLTFDWKNANNSIGNFIYDFLSLNILPYNSVTEVVNSFRVPDNNRLYFFNENTFTNFTLSGIDSLAGKFKRIIISWENNNSNGIQPPGAIDNIEISYDLPATGPYSFEWTGPITSSEQNLINVQSGNYNVKVTDALGCNNEKNIIIKAPPILNLASEVINNLCYGKAEGSINVTPLNGVIPYNYTWSNGSMSNSISNLLSDTYYLTLTDRSNIIDELPSAASCMPNSTTPGFNIGIYNVNLNSINHNSLSAQIEGFRNFTHIKTYLHQDGENYLNVQTGPDYEERVLAWIDFNNNGIFEGSELIMNSANSLPNRFHRNKFSIPQNAIKYTPLRLRVGSDISDITSGLNTFKGPCNSSKFGQIEDYTIIIGYPACSIYTFEVLEPLPIEATLSLHNSQILCEGDSLDLSVTEAYSYLWSTSDTTQTILMKESGDFFVIVTDSIGCTAISDTITVLVHPLPTPTVNESGATTFCSGGRVMLSSSVTGASYLWSNNETTQSISATMTGNYSVEVTDANGCKGTSTAVIVTENPLPTPTVNESGATTFCSGNSVTLSSSVTGVSYLWNNNTTTQNISATTTGNYSVEVTDANGCKGTSTAVKVTENPLPVPIVNASGETAFCSGNNVTLSSSVTGVSYLWSNNATTKSIAATTTGNYSVEVTDANGCKGTSTAVTVTENPLPAPIVNASGETTFCSGKSVTLSSSITGVSYLWSNHATTQSVSATMTGNYSVEVTDANGCSAISSDILVTVNPLLISEITITPSANAICSGDTVTFTSTTTNGGQLPTYEWYVNGNLQGENGPVFSTNSLTNNEQVLCRMTSNAECLTEPMVESNIISIAVNHLLTPEVSISTTSASILACQSATFTATPIHGGISPTYQWFLNGNQVSNTATYTSSALIHGDQIFCRMTSTAICKTSPIAQSNAVTMSVSPPSILISGDTISSANYTDAKYVYRWYFNGTEVSASPFIICSQFGSGSYYLVINYNGCTVPSNSMDIVCTVPTNDIGNINYFIVYPNPTNNIINISGINISSDEFRIVAYNLLGQKLEEKRISVSDDIFDSHLDMNNYVSGIYTIVIYSSSHRQVFKVYKIE